MQTARKKAREKQIFRRTVSVLLTLALVLFGGAAPVLAAGELPLTVSGRVQHAVSLLILEEINRIRAEQDPSLEPLTAETPLQELADLRSVESVLYDAPVRPDLQPVAESIAEAAQAEEGAEIRGKFDTDHPQAEDVEKLVADWLENPESEATLLSAELKTIGIGTFSHPDHPDLLLANIVLSDADSTDPFAFDEEKNEDGAILPTDTTETILLSPELAAPLVIEEAERPEAGIVIYRASMPSRIPELNLEVPASVLEWTTDNPDIGTFPEPGVLHVASAGPVKLSVHADGMQLSVLALTIEEESIGKIC